MKIIQINVCSNVFSTGKIVSGIGEIIREQGWSSFIFYGRSGKECSSKSYKIGNKFEQRLHVLESRLFDNSALGFGSYFATKKLISKIKKLQPDVIHLHVLLGYYINARVLLEYLALIDVPIIITLHSCWEFTGHCTHYDYEQCVKWKVQCCKCPLKTEYPQSWFFDNSKRNYSKKKKLFLSIKNLHLVTVSHWLKNQVKESFLKEKDVTVIYNGVDLDVFKPLNCQNRLKNKYGFGNKKVLIALASTWTPKKGVDDYLKIADRLVDDNILLVMVGYQSKPPITLPSNLIPLPITTRIDDIVELYNVADIVLNLSYEETFGLTTVEGLACGTPSIVYNRTASPELVDENTGQVVTAGDIDALHIAINTILKKGKEYYTIACRERAVALFDRIKTYNQYIGLYKSLIES